MIYTVKKANLLSEQFRKFTDSDSWIVVGQYGNLDFWFSELASAKRALDEHNQRFDTMFLAQKNWIEKHDIRIDNHCGACGGICEFGERSRKVSLPKKSKNTSADKKEAKRELLDSAYFFLLRCYNIGLINELVLRQKCTEIGTSIDLSDISKSGNRS